jgi:chorismate synthase
MNSFGRIFRVTTFGESHGAALGCVVDGCPAGLSLSLSDVQSELDLRKPGGGGASTTRAEADEAEILSGLFEGRTLGTPIAVIIRNKAHNSSDYDDLKDVYRPGHADWCWEAKFGLRDHRGGGRSSARETAGRVAAGAIAKRFLSEKGISVRAWTQSIAGLSAPNEGEADFDIESSLKNSLRLPCAEKSDSFVKISQKIEELRKDKDSAGGIVACRAFGLPAGLGAPVFEKLDARIAEAMLSIGAAKGVEFGSGFLAEKLLGSQNNDAPVLSASASLQPSFDGLSGFSSNNAGGVLGGISNGMPLVFNVAFKPVPSISKPQQTVDKDGKSRELSIKGRHDVCVCPRAVSVVEAMTALVLADLLLEKRCNTVAGTVAGYEQI